MKDTYFTISKASEGLFKDKGSKFLAFVFPCSSEEEALEKLDTVKQDQPKARHHCFAYRIGLNADIERFNDDGEPSGTAGRPILGQLISAELTNTVCIVVRYFGGTKLGVSGLIEAYRESTKDAIAHAKIIQKRVSMQYSITCPYADIPMLMESLKFADIEMFEKNFEKEAELKVHIPLSEKTEKWNIAATHYIGHSATLKDLQQHQIRIQEIGIV